MLNFLKSWRPTAALAVTATLLAACGGGSSDVAGGTSTPAAETTLTLVAYAVPEPGWSKIVPAFAATPEGKGVAVTTSYGASGDQSRAVVDGKPADIVNFSVEPDVTRLVKANKVAKDWNADATKGIPFGSVVSLVVRKGNPKNIKDWDDLLQPGLEVVTPSPLSSGSAKWNLLAPYAAKSNGGQNQQAQEGLPLHHGKQHHAQQARQHAADDTLHHLLGNRLPRPVRQQGGRHDQHRDRRHHRLREARHIEKVGKDGKDHDCQRGLQA